MASDNKLLVYVPRLTNRLGYTLNVLFQHVLAMDFEITDNQEFFCSVQRPRLCYGPTRLDDTPWIKSSTLLFSTTLDDIEISYTQYLDDRVPFAVYGQKPDFPFDMLAATFYMVSRYEEYLPHQKDRHGRFLAHQSMAAECHFLHKPIVELWAQQLAVQLEARYPTLTLPKKHLEIDTTVDIDAAFCYLHKGVSRTLLGFLRDGLYRHDLAEVKRRWRVLSKKEPDPFDTFDYILQQQQDHPRSHLTFFALVADYAMYDKPISYHTPAFLELLQYLDDHARMGLHASYASFDTPAKIDKEQEILANITHREVVRNRCHFLRLALPTTYRALLRAGIRHDYTMGYAEAIGFRAGISSPFPFFDIESNYETSRTIHPFSFMDTTLKRYLMQSPDEAWLTIQRLTDSVAEAKGTLSYIFHNENLSETFGWQGWRQLYEETLRYASGLIDKKRQQETVKQ